MVTGRFAIVLVRLRLKNWFESAVNNSGAVSPATRAVASITPVMRPERAARSGLITGVLLATARVAGETAPLLFTALSNQFFSLGLNKTMANLPVTINNFVQSPYAYWKQLAWSGALLITITVLALNIGARILGAERTAK